MYYYEIHVFYSRNTGYSFGIESPEQLDEEDAIALAIKQNKFSEEGDETIVDYVDEISEDVYRSNFSND